MTLLEWLLSVVPGIALGSPSAGIGKTLGAKPYIRNTGLIDFDLKPLDGATRTVIVSPAPDDSVKSIDAIVMFKSTRAKPAKPILTAFKKSVKDALTAQHGAADLTKQKSVPHWSIGNRQFVQLVTWLVSDGDTGLESHHLKLTLVTM